MYIWAALSLQLSLGQHFGTKGESLTSGLKVLCYCIISDTSTAEQ